jgi:hypothetical protein
MIGILRIAVLVSVAVLTTGVTYGQATLPSADAAPFMGTWVFSMTEPAGAVETVRVWDDGGRVAASVQAGKFPAINASSVVKDADLLVLTAKRFENGKQIWAVIALTRDGDGMRIAQMLEQSTTVKLGSGKKMVN